MEIPWWKKTLSYLTEVSIEKTSSPYNKHLEVSLKSGRLMLSTHNAIYSYSDKYDNFGDAFKRMKLDNIEEVLLLGFGLGSIPLILEKTEGKNLSYTGVEIDEEVIYLASKYVLPQLKSDISLFTSEAMAFLALDQSKYDLIAMDIFESDYIPHQFETESFLYSLNEHLTIGGVLMYNRLAYTDEDVKKSEEYFHNVFSKVFPNACYLTIKGNMMLFNRKDVLK
ncbi:MAG: hypothetical protein HKN68_06015 [Saprospiraceae bacterium]|nr:hypothetical protein [Saprospiraceae bacterium]